MPTPNHGAEPELLVVNARVHRTPADPEPPEAIAISGDVIAGVGRRDDLPRSPRSRVIDLGGRTVVLDADPFREPEALASLVVRATMVGGSWVHGAEGLDG